MQDKLTETSAFKRLAKVYRERLESALPVIDGYLGDGTEVSLRDVEVLAHGMAGTGGTFGFPEITAAGRRLDEYIVGGGAEEAKVAGMLRDLRGAIGTALEAIES